jgi:hypothetical protein
LFSFFRAKPNNNVPAIEPRPKRSLLASSNA